MCLVTSSSNPKRQEYETFLTLPLINKLLSLDTGKTTEIINASFPHLCHNEDCLTLAAIWEMAYLMVYLFYFRNVLEKFEALESENFHDARQPVCLQVLPSVLESKPPEKHDHCLIMIFIWCKYIYSTWCYEQDRKSHICERILEAWVGASNLHYHICPGLVCFHKLT